MLNETSLGRDSGIGSTTIRTGGDMDEGDVVVVVEGDGDGIIPCSTATTTNTSSSSSAGDSSSRDGRMLMFGNGGGSSGPGTDAEDEDEWREYENRAGLSSDLRFLAGMPELCDVMFMVGEQREPIYGVKAILAIRSRVFYKMLYGPRSTSERARGVTSGSGAVARRISRFFTDSTGLKPSLSHGNLNSGGSNGIHSNGSGGGGGGNNHGLNNNHHRTMVVIDEFEPDVFKELLQYIHIGSVQLRPKTLLGLMNAADHFGIEDLRRACAQYSSRCIRLDTVCSLLVTAEKYIQYKSTKMFIQKVLEFVDQEGEEVLNLRELVHLPMHVMQLILSREELQANHLTRYRAAERWARHHSMEHPSKSLTGLMRPLVRQIAFQDIPTSILIREIQPLNVVPDNLLMNALAYQADPSSIPHLPTPQSTPLLQRNGGRDREADRARLFQLCSESGGMNAAGSSSNVAELSSSGGGAGSRSRSVEGQLSKLGNGGSRSDVSRGNDGEVGVGGGGCRRSSGYSSPDWLPDPTASPLIIHHPRPSSIVGGDQHHPNGNSRLSAHRIATTTTTSSPPSSTSSSTSSACSPSTSSNMMVGDGRTVLLIEDNNGGGGVDCGSSSSGSSSIHSRRHHHSPAHRPPSSSSSRLYHPHHNPQHHSPSSSNNKNINNNNIIRSKTSSDNNNNNPPPHRSKSHSQLDINLQYNLRM